jgi:hypothetical protein
MMYWRMGSAVSSSNPVSMNYTLTKYLQGIQAFTLGPRLLHTLVNPNAHPPFSAGSLPENMRNLIRNRTVLTPIFEKGEALWPKLKFILPDTRKK